jgi:signal peptidase I
MYRRVACAIPTDAMAPTFMKDQRIIVDTHYYVTNKPRRWDVVVFSDPELELLGPDLGRQRIGTQKVASIANAAVDIFEDPAADPNNRTLIRPHTFYIKRIIGLAGEKLHFRPNEIVMNGKPVSVPPDLRHAYGKWANHASFKFAGSQEYEVPDYHLFVMSDNHAKGKDSREFGAIPEGALIGRVVG